jgi:type VI secretion system protein ImpL
MADWRARFALATGLVLTGGASVLATIMFNLKLTDSLLVLVSGLLACLIVALVALKPVSKLKMPATFTPDGKEQNAVDSAALEKLAVFKARLNHSINVLKRLKIVRGRRKRKALYTLPLYMLIGTAGSGKTSILRHSGLNFTSLDPDFPDPKLQGLHGTTHCDIWYSDEAILLDTAGRYMHPTAEKETREEWWALLHALKKLWRREPINGVIATANLADEREETFNLLAASMEQIEVYAKYMRQRLDELMKTLKLRMPVYLVFAKCDLLAGFVEYFADLGVLERDQIFGCTIPEEQQNGKRPLLRFREEFERLYFILDRKRVRRLGLERKPHHLRKVYGFPLELKEAYEKMAHFVAALMEPNLYQEQPMFRGFFFTSATQTGKTFDRVIRTVAQEFGVGAESGLEPPAEWNGSDAYFIKELVSKVIVPGRALAGPLTKIGRFRSLVSDVAVVALAVVMFALGASYLGNRNYFDAILSKVEAVNMSVEKHEELTPQIEKLEALRAQIEKYEKGEPFYLRWLGAEVTYKRRQIIAAAKRLYFTVWKEKYFAPVVLELEMGRHHKVEFRCEHSDHIKAETAILMLANKAENRDHEFLAEQFARVFAQLFVEWKISPIFTSTLGRQVDYSLQQLGTPYVPYIKIQEISTTTSAKQQTQAPAKFQSNASN